MPTIETLRHLQALPLDIKIETSKQRIREWVNHYGIDNVFVSFSGGKDSTVMLDIVRSVYPDIKAVFSDTGLEYPEIREFVKQFDNVQWVKPKMNFKQVIIEVGYPFISKRVASAVDIARRHPYGEVMKKEFLNKDKHENKFDVVQWKPLLYTDFDISATCCDIMKKEPMNKLKGFPFIGLLTEESINREQLWLDSGCNGFDLEHPHSTPLAFWKEQDILQYVSEKGLPISKAYGDVVYEGCKYRTTKCDRTGCVFCGFGAHLEKEGEGRYERLKITHPELYDYCMRGGMYNDFGLWIPSNNGLGMKHVIDEINYVMGKTLIRY